MKTLVWTAIAALPCLTAQAQTTIPAQAEGVVKRGIAYAKANGMEKLFQQVNQSDGIFHVGKGSELFLFVYDQQGVMKAFGFNSVEFVGKHRIDVKDADGKLFVRDIVKVAQTKGNGWVDYKFTNPVTNKVEPKSTYVEMFNDLIFCCGIYKK